MNAFEEDISRHANNWNFLLAGDYCTKPDKQKPLIDQLTISASVPFKLIKKYKILKWLLYALGFLVIAAAASYVIKEWNSDIISIRYGAVALVLVIFVVGFFSKFLVKLLDVNGYIKKLLFLIALATFGWLNFNVYVLNFNPLYNRMGKIKKDK